ncbi:MAG: FG-GAP repeat domain-containing protein [Pseudolabrys sp.]
MRLFLLACLALSVAPHAGQATEWQVQKVDVPARVTAVDTVDGETRVNAGGLWYRLVIEGDRARLAFIDKADDPEPPDGALADGRVVTGTRDIARAWLSEPTNRYDHGVLGDKTEAGSLTIETRDGMTHLVKLKNDAVFEDLSPRLADLDGNGNDEVVLVKSYVARGSALAVIGLVKGRYDVIAETPPIGAPHRWLNPAGIADFDGDGKKDVAIVRMPHAVGQLELWSYADKNLRKTAEMPDATNHMAGSRAIGMSAAGDFDGDGVADLALPSFDRTRLRLIGFVPGAHEIASVALPAKAATDMAPAGKAGRALALGLEDGSLVVVRPAR